MKIKIQRPLSHLLCQLNHPCVSYIPCCGKTSKRTAQDRAGFFLLIPSEGAECYGLESLGTSEALSMVV